MPVPEDVIIVQRVSVQVHYSVQLVSDRLKRTVAFCLSLTLHQQRSDELAEFPPFLFPGSRAEDPGYSDEEQG